MSGEDNWYGYFFRNAKDDDSRGKKDPFVAGLVRYGRVAGGASAKADYRNEMNTFGYAVELDNNSNRTVDGEMSTDAANPRFYTDMKDGKESKGNVNGHTIRTAQKSPAATAFKWGVYLFASEADAVKRLVNLSGLTGLTDDNDLSAPDGLAFSEATGLCWIQTDDSAYTDKTNCMLLAGMPGKVGDGGKKTLAYKRADGCEKRVDTYVGRAATPATLKRFLVGPKDCEITGLCETPDGRALFINIQHPGETTKMDDVNDHAKYTSQWPANAGYGAGKRPRSATVVTKKIDGGRIGI